MSAATSHRETSIDRAIPSKNDGKPDEAELLSSDTSDPTLLAFGTSHGGKPDVLQRIRLGAQSKSQDTAISSTPHDGISELHLRHNGLHYLILDIPGAAGPVPDLPFPPPQPPHVAALIFVANLAGYDQPLPTDVFRTELQADLDLFDTVSNAPRFRTTPIILYLNNVDEFRSKLSAVPLRNFFPEFQSLGFQEDAMLYVCEKFAGRDRGERGDVYTHVTSRGDGRDLLFLVDAVRDIVELKSERVAGEIAG